MDALTEEKFKNLDEKLDNVGDSLKHVVAVVEEVRDLETANAARVDGVEKQITEHDQIIWNGGKNGLVMRVDRLEQKIDSMRKDIEEYKKSKSERVAWVIAIASLVASVVNIFIGK